MRRIKSSCNELVAKLAELRAVHLLDFMAPVLARRRGEAVLDDDEELLISIILLVG